MTRASAQPSQTGVGVLWCLTVALLTFVGLGFGPAVAYADPSPSSTPSISSSSEDEEEEEEEEEPSIGLITGCLTDDHAELQVTNNLWGSDGQRFEWTLRRGDVVITREVFAWFDDDSNGPEPDQLTQTGNYTITITREGQSTVVTSAAFEILRCVTAESGCHTMTFSNPPDNPALQIGYGAGEDDGSDDEDVNDQRVFTLPPGESRTVTTLRESAGWEASRVIRGNQLKSFGGEDYQVDVDQHCGPTMTRSVVGCARGGRAQVDLQLNPPSDRGVRYKIYDFHELVDAGVVGQNLQLKLSLKPSTYDVRLYSADGPLPYDRLGVAVQPCPGSEDARLAATGGPGLAFPAAALLLGSGLLVLALAGRARRESPLPR